MAASVVPQSVGRPAHSAPPAAPQALAQKSPLAAQPLSLSVENSSPRATFRKGTSASADRWPLRNVGSLAAALRKNVAIRDRVYHMKVYPNCFLGKDAITWLVKSGTAGSREEAAVIGSAMITAGYFHHVVDDHSLKDQSLFYRFYCDEEKYASGLSSRGLPVKGSSSTSTRGKSSGSDHSELSSLSSVSDTVD